MITGLGAHSILPLQKSPTAAFSLMLGVTGHAIGWCIPKGGSQKLVDALAEYLKSLGGEIQTGQMVRNINELPPSKAILLDITPRQILEITGNILPESYRRQLAKYRYGAGVFKIDYALSGPVPWLAPECREASTVHLGGKMEEVVIAERLVGMGRVPERPFVLVAQSSCFDPGRAPEGKHTLWAYCHLPNGCETDMTARIEAQIERFAPGFRELVLARKITRPADMEAYNPNYVGGDINGGSQDWGQLFTRPVARLDPYSTPAPNLFICSSSTPPGGGVHGMCGYWAARSALRTVLA
jgi:phytoene dehydrogenase-like protein